MTSKSQNPVLICQYLKKLRFVTPDRFTEFPGRNGRPEFKVDMIVDFVPSKGDVATWEMSIELAANALYSEEKCRRDDNGTHSIIFSLQVCYGAMVTISGATHRGAYANLREDIVKLVFPACRNILARTTRAGGFPELVLNFSDFDAGQSTERNKRFIATVNYSGCA